jgi:hypothetical protein
MSYKKALLWLCLAAFVGACSSSNSSDNGRDSATADASIDALVVDQGLSELPLTEPLSVSLSDMPGVAFIGRGQVEITSLELGDDPRTIAFSLSAWTSNEQHIGRITAWTDSTRLASLAAGQRVEIPEVNATGTRAVVLFESPGGAYERRLIAAQLRFESSAAVLTLELGPRAGENTNVTMEVRGQYPVYCAVVGSQGVMFDPSWTSEFCQTTRTELGLGAWIDAMM